MLKCFSFSKQNFSHVGPDAQMLCCLVIVRHPEVTHRWSEAE